jgi:hypothetical protein
MIVRSAGLPDPELPVTAACVADEARAARGAVGSAVNADGQTADLVEITTVTGSRLHVSRILCSGPGEGLLLFVDLDRGRSNLGLASRQVDQLAPAVLG